MPLPELLVFGSNGQLGSCLTALAGERIEPVSRTHIDLENPGSSLEDLIAGARVDAVVNAAAWTAVDMAESCLARARSVNAHAPALMARACARRGLPFIHVSTDYVFDGDKTAAWSEDDTPNPLNVYGRTKLEGEHAVLDACPDALIIRTSWVVSEFGKNFVKSMLGLSERPVLKIVGDQRGVPTDANALATFILDAAERMSADRAPGSGVLHFRSAGESLTWATLAAAIFDAAGGEQPSIQPITTAEYGAPARRPLNSELSIDRLQERWGYTPPHWRDGLDRILCALRTAK